MRTAVITESLHRTFLIIGFEFLFCTPFTPFAMPPAVTGEMAAVAQTGGGSASTGRSLFTGTVKLRNGGPPCRTCHSMAGLPFPNGGTLGPDLTMISAKLGPQGIGPTLQTLFFPTMTPIYDQRPLTLMEQSDLKAFFQEAGSGPPLQPITPVIVSVAAAGFLLLMILTRAIWRHRLRGVRKGLFIHAGQGSQS